MPKRIQAGMLRHRVKVTPRLSQGDISRQQRGLPPEDTGGECYIQALVEPYLSGVSGMSESQSGMQERSVTEYLVYARWSSAEAIRGAASIEHELSGRLLVEGVQPHGYNNLFCVAHCRVAV